MKKIIVVLFVLFAANAFGQSYSEMELENFRMNWHTFRCESLATASGDTDTVIVATGYIANLKVYAFAAELKVKIGFTGNDTLSEWLRISSADSYEFPGLFPVGHKYIYILGTGAGSARITYTIY